MKRLSDYQGEDAIELWADLLEPLSIIFTDEELRKSASDGSLNTIKMAKVALKNHKKEALEILTRIDDTPVNGLNILTRLIGIFSEIGESDESESFFGFAEQDKKE